MNGSQSLENQVGRKTGGGKEGQADRPIMKGFTSSDSFGCTETIHGSACYPVSNTKTLGCGSSQSLRLRKAKMSDPLGIKASFASPRPGPAPPRPARPCPPVESYFRRDWDGGSALNSEDLPWRAIRGLQGGGGEKL